MAVNKANARIMGFVARLRFNQAPSGAKITIAKPKGTANFQFIILLSPKVKAGTDVFATFNSIPMGIAWVLKSIPSQNRIGTYRVAPPLPSIENTNAIIKKRMGTK